MKPTIVYPTHSIKQPSTGKSINFRPYVIKEEKILLMAKQTKEPKDAYQAIISILNACCLNPSFDAAELPLFDLELMFLKLRALSVNNVEKLPLKDPEDDKRYEFIVNFDDIKVIFPESAPNKTVKIPGQKGKEIVITLKYPAADIYFNTTEEITTKIVNEDLFDFVYVCIDKVYQGEDLCEMTKEEMKEFIDSLPKTPFREIVNFIGNLPYVYYESSFTNSLGTERKVTFHSFMDFFFFL